MQPAAGRLEAAVLPRSETRHEHGSPLSPRCLQAYASPEAAVLARLYVKLVNDYLNETAYDAELAGLSYGLSNTINGFRLSFYG